jgi:MoxR-like ATPase
MNDDASTFELPEYIHSRLQPQIFIDFPERDEEHHILRENLPFAEERILQYVTDFLQMAHAADERYTVRDGINVARFAIKLKSLATQRRTSPGPRDLHQRDPGEEALRYVRPNRPSAS